MQYTVSLIRALRFGAHFVGRFFAPGRFTAKPMPVLSVETTNICNSNCVFCANSAMTRKKMYIDMAAFEALVADFAVRGGKQIDFNVTIGDPLLDKQLLARARYVRRYPQFESL